MHINLLGRCDKCDHIVTRIVKVRLDDACMTPCDCPECHKGTVYFEELDVHHRMKESGPTPGLIVPSRLTFKRARGVFQWGMLSISLFIMTACGFFLRYSGGMAPIWRYLIIAGMVVGLAFLWWMLCRLYDRAAASDWKSQHRILPSE